MDRGNTYETLIDDLRFLVGDLVEFLHGNGAKI